MVSAAMDLYREAVGRFQELFARARRSGLQEPTVVTLATADRSGRSSARMVLLKEADERGFVFYTNTLSRKGRQLAANPRTSLCFFWDPLMEQVMVEGVAEPVSEAQADAYWATRPRESQLASLISLQSEPLESREALEKRMAEAAARFEGKPVPRPAHWSGYRVVPDRIEFWKRRPFRLNERTVYQKGQGGWAKALLYP